MYQSGCFGKKENWFFMNRCVKVKASAEGRSSLLSHYQSKIIYKNNELKKLDNDNKYKIPNKYIEIFNSIYPN